MSGPNTTIAGGMLADEMARRYAFPVAEDRIYMAHAGVCPLPRCASEAVIAYARAAEHDNQEAGWGDDRIHVARRNAAELIGAKASEIAFLGPTSVGLSLVAQGLDWQPGDEVVFYGDDYPANVYPWRDLARHGVRPVVLHTTTPGAVTWDTIEPLLSDRTRLVSLASCHYLSGVRVDIDTIGRNLHERGILFCVDGIQTVGAFPTRVDHIDFLSADSHKWMLGPAAAGIFYVDEAHHDRLRPALLGSYNVVSPEFIAQAEIQYYAGARRYEPGMLNLPGIAGMDASITMLRDYGVDRIGSRLLELRAEMIARLESLGFVLYAQETYDSVPGALTSGIVTVSHPARAAGEVFERLREERVSASLRQDRAGNAYLRFSPHFYNTMEEIDRVAEILS